MNSDAVWWMFLAATIAFIVSAVTSELLATYVCFVILGLIIYALFVEEWE